MTKQNNSLIQRYTILKPELEELIQWTEDSNAASVVRETLELLKDTFSGEDEEIV